MQLTVPSAITSWWLRTVLFTFSTNTRRERKIRRVRMAESEEVLAAVKAAVHGDGEAYARLIERYQAQIARRMCRFAGNAGQIEELVHEVFVEAYFSLSSYRGDAPLEHWLQRIATRVGYRFWKQKQKRKSVPLEDHLNAPELQNDLGLDDETMAIGAALERLPPRDRLVLTLLYLEGRSVAEAADLAGWSQSMIKVQAYRARKKLRKLLPPLKDSL